MTDHEIRDAIDNGAETIAELARDLGAGARCRGCWPVLEELLDEGPRQTVATGAA